ncbi:MAG: hypothetical protein QM704_16155 [Anaeromyxobacteraceae bacterium]
MLLTRFQSRFLDPAVERRFREEAHAEETRLLAAVQGTWFLVLVLYARNDFLLFEGAQLHALLAVRAVMLAALVAPVVVGRLDRGPVRRDASAFLSVVVVVLGGLYVTSTRPGTISPAFATNVVGILSSWVLLPLPWRLQALSGLVVTAGALATVLLRPHAWTAVEVSRLVIEFILANAMGAWTSLLFHRTRRQRWDELLQRREAELALREVNGANEKLVGELRGALEQVKTLKGLLPICMHCHKIRNDTGYWSRLEQYIEERTDAAFSHALCPDCYRQHYDAGR